LKKGLTLGDRSDKVDRQHMHLIFLRNDKTEKTKIENVGHNKTDS
jgi:hypothetical protein